MKVKKKSDLEVQLSEDLVARISQNSFVQWFVENPKFLLYACLTLLVIFFLMIRWSAGNWFKTESDYIRAEIDFSSLKQLPMEDNAGAQTKILTNLKEIIRSHPELHSRYDAEIAQILIARGNSAEAAHFLKNFFEDSQNSESFLKFYKEFSKITVLIDEEKFEIALQKALALKQDLINQAQEINEKKIGFNDGLFAYNLLRIAFLQQQLKDDNGELNTWKEWKLYATGKITEQSDLFDAQVFRDIATQFEENDISLQDYIKFREEKLSS